MVVALLFLLIIVLLGIKHFAPYIVNSISNNIADKKRNERIDKERAEGKTKVEDLADRFK